MAEVRIYNTLTRQKEAVTPSNPDGKIRMYECGITPQSEPHIGHARTAITFDTLRRWLEFRGMPVIHVKNVTDIEDKIIEKALKEGIRPPSWSSGTLPLPGPCSEG
jgi:cysteinyl-tRNA synthetase